MFKKKQTVPVGPWGVKNPWWLDKCLTHGCSSMYAAWVDESCDNNSPIIVHMSGSTGLAGLPSSSSVGNASNTVSRNLEITAISYQGKFFSPQATPSRGNMKIRLKSKVSVMGKVPTFNLWDANPSRLLIGNHKLLHPMQLLENNVTPETNRIISIPTPPPPDSRIRRLRRMLTSCYGHNTPTLPHLASMQSLSCGNGRCQQLNCGQLSSLRIQFPRRKGTKEQRRKRGEACICSSGAATARYARLEVTTTSLHLSAPGSLPTQSGLPNPMQTLRG